MYFLKFNFHLLHMNTHCSASLTKNFVLSVGRTNPSLALSTLTFSPGMPRMKDIYVYSILRTVLPHEKLRNDLTLSRQRAARVPLTFPFCSKLFKRIYPNFHGIFFLVISNFNDLQHTNPLKFVETCLMVQLVLIFMMIQS